MNDQDDGTKQGIAAMLAGMLEVLTDKRNEAYDRGDTERGSEIGRQINILGGAAVEIGALSIPEHNRIVEREGSALPPDRGILADIVTARLTIERHVDGHDDADLPAAAAMLQRALDSLEAATSVMERGT